MESLAIKVERALDQTGLEQLAIGGGVAANGPLRDRLSALGVALDVPPPRAVHRQRGDDRQRRQVRARRCRIPDYLDLDVYASGERTAAAR